MDGSARERLALGRLSADREAISVGMDAGGTLRTLSGLRGTSDARRVRPGHPAVQSLPEKVAVLCPPGTQPFRGPFFCASSCRAVHILAACAITPTAARRSESQSVSGHQSWERRCNMRPRPFESCRCTGWYCQPNNPDSTRSSLWIPKVDPPEGLSSPDAASVIPSV